MVQEIGPIDDAASLGTINNGTLMVSRKQNTRTGKKNGSALAGGFFEEFVD